MSDVSGDIANTAKFQTIYEEKESKENKIITINGTQIPCRVLDGCICINATKLCMAGGKRFNDWYKTKTAQRFVTNLSLATKIFVQDLIKLGVNQNKQTWVDRRIAYKIAEWISVDFELQVNKWLDELLATHWCNGVLVDPLPATPI